MIAALDARDRNGRRRSVLPMQSDVTCGPKRIRSGCSPGRTRCGRRHIQGLGARTLLGSPGLSHLEPGESSLRALRPGRFRELKSANGDQEIPSPPMESARYQCHSNRDNPGTARSAFAFGSRTTPTASDLSSAWPRSHPLSCLLVFCGNRPPGDGAHDPWLCPSRLFQSRVTRISPRGPKRGGESIPIQNYDSRRPLPRDLGAALGTTPHGVASSPARRRGPGGTALAVRRVTSGGSPQFTWPTESVSGGTRGKRSESSSRSRPPRSGRDR
jgi:hypothetical protein